MKLRYVVLGAPCCVLWLLFFTVAPLPAVTLLLIALAWRDHHHRTAARAGRADVESAAASK